MRTISTTTTTLSPMATITYSPITTTTTSSPWHSPIPYLFGGIAAMLGLIAFALLMLACSYLKLSSQTQAQTQEEEEGDGYDIGIDLENNKEGEDEKKELFKGYKEKILVIMAGDEKPSFLATPVCHVYGKQSLCKDCCEMGIGKSDESFSVSDEKETLDKENNNHVVHVSGIAGTTTTSQEHNEGSQETQQEEEH